ncbi:T-cell-specific guanine nucleotide triphosphate-binding protein 2-like [Mercenaria mercenaria]|uniref:T-cell-specific guanine nucleotide triphosphate-binding protein 2-like n=1 Tax=Mercenaria mercenaria TaxID=6596 RepID=UPI00234F3E58|nr:T-cell-specific guanine nucleotide triphosphate-binding protein 2-like [Mercenaria mercenaria]
MDTVIVAIICVLVCNFVSIVVWFCQGFRRRKSIEENNTPKTTVEENYTSKAQLTTPVDKMAMAATTHERSDSLPRECTSVSSEQNDEQKGSDEVICCENQEQTFKNDIREDTGNIEFDKFRPSVHLDKLQKKMTEMRPIHGLCQHIKDSLDAWNNLELNVAVTGNAGVGKSSLINALRKVKPSDKNAAKVDVVETTTEGKKYTYPENQYVAIWDLPGTGTQKFLRQKYLEEMDFSRFNVVIIVSAGRFLQDDIWLGKELLHLRKNILFVRTKIDIDMMNAKRDHPDDFNEADCMAKIRNNLTDNIRIGGIPDSVSGIYLVSSPESTSYDFAELDKKLKSLLNIKGKAIRAMLQKPVEEAIRADQAFNKNEFKGWKAVSAIYGFLPIPNLETGLGNMSISSIREKCLEKFCIDESSLDKISDDIDESSLDKTSDEVRMSPKDVLKRRLKSYRAFKEGTLLTSVEEKNWSTFRQFSKYMVPVIGFFLSAHKAYFTTQACLETMCDEMAEDELKLVKLRLDGLEKELQPLKNIFSR